MTYIDTWDLDSVFPGGTQSEVLQEKLSEVKEHLKDYEATLKDWQLDDSGQSKQAFKVILDKQEKTAKALGQARTFVRMSLDAYMNDEHGPVVYAQIMDLYSDLSKLTTTYQKKLVHVDDQTWQRILGDETFKDLAFSLNEIRDNGKRLLSDETESLLAELNQDGLQAWSQLYDTVVSGMTIPFINEAGEEIDLSVGQAMNRMSADPEPKVREQLFTSWEQAWEKVGPVLADTINHLAGYRLTVQKAHGYDHHLDQPLELNRMKKATLDAMWGAVSKSKEPFIQYLQQKAKVLGLEKLGMEDVNAPVTIGDNEATSFTYDEACEFILEHFASFGPKLTDFTKKALDNRWVEAENRPNKRPGGYCTSLPEFNESRIFMTFTGTPSDVSTLAHELGHAFHSHAMKDLPQLKRGYAMNVAETASTFAENIIDNAAIQTAKTKEEKISLLASKLETATAMFLNIHARFLFEDQFYTERQTGFVSHKRLNELMIEAQREAYEDSLASYHPHFWASKLHFFINSVPFYNYPYTFGYLFSLGIYAQYLQEPAGFEEKYIALLRDTGSMEVEELAKKHLNVDITDETFWTAGIEIMVKDVQEFIELTNEYV